MDFKKIWDLAKPHVLILGIFLVVFAAYFHPQLNGKVVAQRDIQQGMGMTKEVNDYHKKTGDYTLWTNAMFGGMPTYQISSPQNSNLIRRFIEPTMQLFIKAPISWFFVAAVSFYILLLVLGTNRWVAAIGGLAFAFSTNHVILFAEGHTSKFRAISYLPLVLAGVYVLLKKQQYLKGAALFLIGMSLNIAANHYQMTYYFIIGMALFMLVYLYFAIREGQLAGYLKAVGIMLVCGVLAVGPSFSKLYTTYEYSKDTMRGVSDLKKERLANTPAKEEVQDEGLNWDYAMMWSNAPIDILSTYIPGVAGGSMAEEVGPNYEIARYFGNGQKSVQAPLYWGGADSMIGPVYFGAIVAFLLILGLFVLPNNGWKLGVLAAMIIIMMLSLGRYFEVFNRFFFDHFPKYTIFRAHNSAMGVVAVFFPILAMLGLSAFLNSDASEKEKKKILIRATGILGGLTLLIIVLGGSLFSFSHFKDEVMLMQYFNNDQARFDDFMAALQDSRAQYMRNSALRSLIFIVLAAGVLWIFVTSKVKKSYVIIGLGALILIDLVSTDIKYLNEDNFVSARKYERPFTKRPVDQQIEQLEPNGRGYYRVLDLSINTFSSSNTSYFHNTIGGYSAVKMARIQDVIDTFFASKRGISYDVLDMMNTKYIIDGERKLHRNPGALGNAWFVDSFTHVPTATEELHGLDLGFHPNTTAVIHDDFNEYTKGLKSHPTDPNAKRSITMTQYEPNRLVYQTDCANDEFAVFSEIWYGPNKGWVAYVDGEPVEHIRANYLLRAMKIPAGKHEIIFEFKPHTFEVGERVSMASSVIIILLVLGWLFMGVKDIFKD